MLVPPWDPDDYPMLPTYYRLQRFLAWTKRHSPLFVPDVFWRQLEWGSDYPKNWRRELVKWAGDPTLETTGYTECCSEAHCILANANVRHRHFGVKTCYWGVLERFVPLDTRLLFVPHPDYCHAEDFENHFGRWPERDFELYDPVHRKTLRQLRRERSIVSVYWPTFLFGGSRRVGWTPRQHAISIAITREITRPTQRSADCQFLHELIQEGMVHSATVGDSWIRCPLLDSQAAYVTFGGNGRRSGRSYRIVGRSNGGWLSRIGYKHIAPIGSKERQHQILEVLRDLQVLSERLKLTVVGYRPEDSRGTWMDIDQLITCAKSRYSIDRVERCSIRLYAFSNWLTEWRQYFADALGFSWIPRGPDDAGPEAHPVESHPDSQIAQLTRQVLDKHSLTYDQLAFALGLMQQSPVSRQRVSNLLRGRVTDGRITNSLQCLLKVGSSANELGTS